MEIMQLNSASPFAGQEHSDTLEDVYIASVETDRGVREQLRIYDTQGLQDGMELPRHYFSVADGFILVYSVDSLESFRRVEQLKRDVDRFRDKKEVVTIILGNKTDLEDYRQVDPEMASQWARGEKVKLWEVTVANRQTLLEPFTMLASKLNQIQSKSTFPLPGRKSKGTPSSDNQSTVLHLFMLIQNFIIEFCADPFKALQYAL